MVGGFAHEYNTFVVKIVGGKRKGDVIYFVSGDKNFL